jgi:hypothetical protein
MIPAFLLTMFGFSGKMNAVFDCAAAEGSETAGQETEGTV